MNHNVVKNWLIRVSKTMEADLNLFWSSYAIVTIFLLSCVIVNLVAYSAHILIVHKIIKLYYLFHPDGILLSMGRTSMCRELDHTKYWKRWKLFCITIDHLFNQYAIFLSLMMKIGSLLKINK